MRLTTVYVVDDERDICDLLTRILSRDGLRVLPFAAPGPALAAMETERPDVVVTDLMMPAMNGLEFAARVKALNAATSVVVMTGFASLENVVDALRSGVDDFITKPFGAAEIRGVVQRVLSRRADSAAARAESPPPPRSSASPPDSGGHLARRLRDMTLLEAIHGFLGTETDSRDLAARIGPVLADALDVASAVIAVPGAGDSEFRLSSATGPVEPAERDADHDLSVLSLIRASGSPAPVEAFAAGPLASHLDAGPIAAAPLRPRDPAGADAGLLLVSRAPGARRFESEELRVLGVTASAMGDVLHALRTAERAEEAYVASLADVVAATEHRTHWFADHSTRVRDVSLRLARHVGLGAADIDTLATASVLLDIGRLHIGDDVLTKTGRLSASEWSVLRSHTEIADSLVRPLGRLRGVKPVIRHHHENWDGTGYPDGLAGEEIPYLASLVRIADAFTALTSPRPWRDALRADDAVARIAGMSGTQFHPQLAAAFAEMHGAGG